MTRSCVYVAPGFSYEQHMVGQPEACEQATLREGTHLRDYPTIVTDDAQKAHGRTSQLVESLQIEFQVTKIVRKLGCNVASISARTIIWVREERDRRHCRRLAAGPACVCISTIADGLYTTVLSQPDRRRKVDAKDGR